MNSVLPTPYPGPGEVVDSWVVEKILGEGGMGCVARAYHVVLQTPVALKFMNPQFMSFPGAVERFINEGKASSLIKSDHVVPVTHAGKTSNGTPYLVMECLDGVDLADLVVRDGSPGLPVERAVHFLLQVLRGLQAAHAVGIIHRDMKPSNCFVVTNDGEEDFVKILDFGISKVAQPGSASLTQTNSALGTPLYMSPEQAKSPRDVDARSDIYSVGVILYELLTGHTPFFSENGEFTEILFKLFTAEPPPVKTTRPDLPDALAEVVHKALARSVDDRFATALEMAEALEPFAADRSKPLITRMRAFKPPQKGHSAPPGHLPSSMAAFSQIGAGRSGAGTDVMADRPRLGTPRVPANFTEAIPGAPGRVVIATPSTANQIHARQDEAVARTQFHSVADGGASTDLGASRDAPAPHPTSKRSIVPFLAFGIGGLAALGLAVAFVATRGGSATTTPASESPSSITAAPSHEVAGPAITPPPPTLPSASASASASATASAAASASASASAPKTAPKPPPTAKPNTNPAPIPGLDNKIQN